MNKDRIKLASPSFGPEELQAVRDVLKSGWVVHGPKNKELEAMIASHFRVRHVVLVNSGASALHATLACLGITGEVILPSFTMSATANAIVTAGAKPVFADIDISTGNIDPDDIEKKINKKTQAILPIHFAGQPANMKKIMALARRNGLKVIEDAAETMGALYDGHVAGTLGDAGCFSFWASKAITTGEGGAIITNDDVLAKRLRAYIAHGIMSTTSERQKSERPWYRDSVMAGYNFRLSNIAAAIGVEQFRKLERFNAARRAHAKALSALVAKIPHVELMRHLPEADHVYQMFIIRVPKRIRDRLVRAMRAEGIEASVHFDPPVHLQTFYRKNFGTVHLPRTEELAKTAVTLPLYPDILGEDIKRIADTLKRAMEKLL